MRKEYFFTPNRFDKKHNFGLKKLLWWRKSKHKVKTEEAAWRRNAMHTQKTTSGKRTKILVSVCGVLVVMWLALLLFSPYFRVRAFSVEGLERIARADVDSTLEVYFSGKYFGVFPRNNYFLIKQDALGEILKSKFPIEQVALTKNFPRTATVMIKEKGHTGVRGDKDGFFLVDPNGLTIEKIKDREKSEVLELVRGGSTTTVAFPNATEIFKRVGEVPIVMLSDTQASALNTEIMRAVQMAYGNLNSIVGQGSSVHHFWLEEENEAFVNVFMVGPGGLVWVVKFSIETSGGDLWDSVRRLWNEIHPGKRNNLEYIDMRFLPRAYYK